MLGKIHDILLVASGKGGVGKSTLAVHLALALAARRKRVGLLDADIYGPSIPTLLGGTDKLRSPDGQRILPIERFGIKLMSMGYLMQPGAAMVWRGPMLSGAVCQFVTDVDWGELDYLICDLPPGTGDVQLTLAQKFKVSGAVLVTTPQVLALADVMRAKAMFDQVKVPVLGLIENMSYFVCSQCTARHEIFDHGGGERCATQLSVPFLGRVPVDPQLRVCGDQGLSMFSAAPESAACQAFLGIADMLHTELAGRRQALSRQALRKRALPIVAS